MSLSVTNPVLAGERGELYMPETSDITEFYTVMVHVQPRMESLPAGNLSVSDTRKQILDLALNALQKMHDSDRYRFSVSARWIPGSLLQVNPEDIESVLPNSDVDRYTRFEVTAGSGQNRTVTEVQLAVEIERFIPVTVRRVLNGEVLRKEDLQKRWVSSARNGDRLVQNLEELNGKTVRRNLAEGQPVRQVDVSSDRVVEAGDPVTLIFEDQGIRIELTGEAREAGAENDEIRIYSNETRRRYLGRIKGPGVAIWKRTL